MDKLAAVLAVAAVGIAGSLASCSSNGEAETVPSSRVARLEARVDALERKAGIRPEGPAPDLTSSTVEELLSRAHELSLVDSGHAEAFRHWDELSRRTLSAELRARVLSGRAWSLMKLERHREAEAAFRELVRHHGAETPEGLDATYRIAWTWWYRDDLERSLSEMERVALAESTDRILRRAALGHAADWAIELGEKDRARPLLERLIEEFGTSRDETDRHFVAGARYKLASLGR